MIALEMTDRGVEVDPLGAHTVHPAAALFPLMVGEALEALATDIAANGQRDPIVFAPSGALLDGRNRVRACARLGITPIGRVEKSEPWAYVIAANLATRNLTDGQRVMVAAGMAIRPSGQRGHVDGDSIDDLPPSRERAAEMFKIGHTQISKGRQVLREGTAALQDLVEADRIPVYTAARVAQALPRDRQDEYARRVVNGADPIKLAETMRVPVYGKPRSEPARQDNRGARRHQHVGVPALRSLRDALDALQTVMRSTDGLDPALTDQEVAQWLSDLLRGRRALSDVIKLLTKLKESTQ